MAHSDFPHKNEFLPIDQAIKIKCRYCEIADICHLRANKEQYEETGMITRCVVTPNRPGEQRKKRKKKAKA